MLGTARALQLCQRSHSCKLKPLTVSVPGHVCVSIFFRHHSTHICFPQFWSHPDLQRRQPQCVLTASSSGQALLMCWNLFFFFSLSFVRHHSVCSIHYCTCYHSLPLILFVMPLLWLPKIFWLSTSPTSTSISISEIFLFLLFPTVSMM